MVGVRLENISKSFGSVAAVEAVDLRIEPGEFYFLLGPSGCGKTTLMRLIAGLAEPTGGRIFFNDREVTGLPTAARNTALVFQNYALWPHMTVEQNVAFGLDVRKTPRQQKGLAVRQALELVRLEGLGDRRPGQLSGGQQQRVALARAMVVRPDLLLLDEPLSNLDAKLRLEMREEIRRLCRQSHTTTIYVTHDQEEAMSLADRIAVMHHGRTVQVGTPAELYRRPRNSFVADFLGKTNLLPATVSDRQADQLVLEIEGRRMISRGQAAAVQPGQRLICSIRPEQVRISRAPTVAGNSLPATHAATTYLGHLAEHTFLTDSGLALTVRELNPSPDAVPRSCHLILDPEALVTLEEE